jgi:hypothetical protein
MANQSKKGKAGGSEAFTKITTTSLGVQGAPSWFSRDWPERLATAGDAVWFYLGKLLKPRPLITIYPRWQIDAAQWASYLALLPVIVILFIFGSNASFGRAPIFWLRLFRGGLAASIGIHRSIRFSFFLGL